MDHILTCLLGAILVVSLILIGIRSALAPTISVKGTTNIPGPAGMPSIPILGHAWKFMGTSNIKDHWDTTERLIASGQKVVSIWIGRKLVIGTADPKLNDAIMNSPKANSKHMDFYGYFNKSVDGVFSRNGKGWSDLRRPLNKLLQPVNIMDNFTSTFEEKVQELGESLDKFCDQKAFDILIHLQTCNLDIIFETMMGIPAVQARKLKFDPHFAKRLSHLVFTLNYNPQYRFGWVFSLSKIKKEFVKLQDQITQFGRRLLECRATILSENGLNPEDPDFVPECFTDIAMKVARSENHEGLTMPTDVIAAGYDTTSVVVSSALLFLAMHPEYQDEAHREQIKIMGDTLRAPNTEEMVKMEYLWLVIQETLRHVGAPALVRQLSSQMVVGDYILPEGAGVYVSFHAMHMNPEYWVKTKEFYPDNFLQENVCKRPRSVYLPFSSGARVCPGKTFAIVSLKITLSMLLRRFKFHTPLKFEEVEYELGLLMESSKGYPVELTRRNVLSAG